MIANGLAAAVHEELNRLPDRFRVPIVLCDLEGRTCEEAARHLGCPIGTIGSRLARGRERLRGRLVRRGLAPAVGSNDFRAVDRLTGSGNARGALEIHNPSRIVQRVGKSGGRHVLSRRRHVSRERVEESAHDQAHVVWRRIGGRRWCRSGGELGPPAACTEPRYLPPRSRATPKPEQEAGLTADFPFMNDKERMKDWLEATIGNMRPLIKDERGVRFQSREAIRYKDGTAKLWSQEKKDPVAPTLRHKGPIREITFFDESNLLVTRSDESIKLWDGLTGEPRKELEGQTIQPMWLSFAPVAKRFVTIDSEHKTVTVWDAVTLAAVATLRSADSDRIVEAGLSGDGKTVVMFRYSPAPSAELCDVASGRTFAILRPPSSAVTEILAEGGKHLNRDKLQTSVGQRDTRFWAVVRALTPAAGGTKESQVKAED